MVMGPGRSASVPLLVTLAGIRRMGPLADPSPGVSVPQLVMLAGIRRTGLLADL